MDDWQRAGIAGAAIGVGATLGMSAIMVAGRRAGWMSRQPPEEIVEQSAMRATGDRPDEPTTDALGAVAHLAFGALGGAAYAVAWSRTLPAAPAPLLGIGYATGIWAASYLGWVPALRLMPPADRDEPGRPIVMVAAHWVYGALLGAAVERVARSRQGDEAGLR
jgi:hypothetical protein